MDLSIKLFDVLFPVFLTIGIGYWYGKKDPKFDTKFITTFAGNFGLPAIIFYSFTTTNISIELFFRFSLRNSQFFFVLIFKLHISLSNFGPHKFLSQILICTVFSVQY